jgi:hypothetical protein
MSTTFCPHCHQPLAETRAGIRLPWRKVQIFDVIRHAKGHGVRIEYINVLCFDGKAKVTILLLARHNGQGSGLAHR